MIYNEGKAHKAEVEYEIVDENLFVSDENKRKVAIKHSILDYPEQDDGGIDEGEKKARKENKLANSNAMNHCLQKYMLFHRLIALFCVFSILVSIMSIHASPTNKEIPIYINNFITFLLIILIAIKFEFNRQLIDLKGGDEYLISNAIDIIVLPHPTIWTPDSNYLLHIFVMLRILLPILYLVYSSHFFDSRAYRIISVYGLSSKEHIFFAMKSVIRSLSIIQILCIEVICIMISTHCLFLMSMDGEVELTFLDCLEVVIVTIPTVGFGEYDLPYHGQKILIVIILVLGVLLNSFIILTIISEMTMSEMEINSYQLQKKIGTKTKIEEISKNYIRKSIELVRKKN